MANDASGAGSLSGVYDVSNIEVLEGLESVRKRPGMYIGNVHDGSALHHLVWEVLDNALDQHRAGFCSRIELTLHADNSVTVLDNGPGMPVAMHPRGMSEAEVVMTVLHAGSQFNHDSYKVSAGLHGVGVSAVNAVCEALLLEVHRDGWLWRQRYCRGKPEAPLTRVSPSERTGTLVHFKPDRQIFTVLEYDHGVLARRLRELSFFNPSLALSLADERRQTFSSPGGLRALLDELRGPRPPVHAPFFADETVHGVRVELGFQWLAEGDQQVVSYVNQRATPGGGSHVRALLDAAQRVAHLLAAQAGRPPLRRGFGPVKRGLLAVLSVHAVNPGFASGDHDKVEQEEIYAAVRLAAEWSLDLATTSTPALAGRLVELAHRRG